MTALAAIAHSPATKLETHKNAVRDAWAILDSAMADMTDHLCRDYDGTLHIAAEQAHATAQEAVDSYLAIHPSGERVEDWDSACDPGPRRY